MLELELEINVQNYYTLAFKKLYFVILIIQKSVNKAYFFKIVLRMHIKEKN